MTAPARVPDAASLEVVLAGLDPASADVGLIPALTAAFPGFAFGIAPIDGDDWRDARSIMRPDSSRLGESRNTAGAAARRAVGDPADGAARSARRASDRR